MKYPLVAMQFTLAAFGIGCGTFLVWAEHPWFAIFIVLVAICMTSVTFIKET